jgi:hypothetical protein
MRGCVAEMSTGDSTWFYLGVVEKLFGGATRICECASNHSVREKTDDPPNLGQSHYARKRKGLAAFGAIHSSFDYLQLQISRISPAV